MAEQVTISIDETTNEVSVSVEESVSTTEHERIVQEVKDEVDASVLELAGSGRTTETVKSNADNQSINWKSFFAGYDLTLTWAGYATATDMADPSLSDNEVLTPQLTGTFTNLSGVIVPSDYSKYYIKKGSTGYSVELIKPVTKMLIGSEKLSISKLSAYYILKSTGALVSNSSFYVKKYDVSDVDNILISGIFKGDIALAAFYSDAALTTVVSVIDIGLSNSVETDVYKQLDIPGGAVYLGVCNANAYSFNVYSPKSNNQAALNELIENNAISSQIAVEAQINKKVPGYYIVKSTGALTANSSFYTKKYDLTNIERIIVSGIFKGDIGLLAFYSDEALTTVISVVDVGLSVSENTKVNNLYNVPSGATWAAISNINSLDGAIFDATGFNIENLKSYLNLKNTNNLFGENVEVDTNLLEDYYFNSTGVLVSAAGFDIHRFAVVENEKYQYDILTSGQIGLIGYFVDEALTQLVKIELSQSNVWARSVGETKVPSGANYMAFSLVTSDSAHLKVYKAKDQDNYIGVIDGEKSYDKFMIPANTLVDQYMTPSGTIGANSLYQIKIYDVRNYKYVRIKGIYAGSIAVYAHSLNSTASALLEIGKTADVSEGAVEYDEIVEVKANYICVTEQITYLRELDLFAENQKTIGERAAAAYIDEGDAIGDSLTNADEYQAELESLIDGIKFVNYGVGGESELTIGARHGSIPALIEEEITLPADTSTVQLSATSEHGLISSWDNAKQVRPLLQGSRGVNPVIVDGVECTLSYSSPYYYLARTVAASETRTIYAGTQVYFNMQKVMRHNRLQIFYVGTNRAWTDADDLISLIKRMIEFSGSSRYIVIGLHYVSGFSIADFEAMEAKYLLAFGNKYYNNRKYMIENALTDAGITPTAQDLIDIAAGTPPDSLRGDSIHFNSIGYGLIGQQLYKLGQNLGYWD